MTTAQPTLTIPDLHLIAADLLPHIDRLRIREISLCSYGTIDLDLDLQATPTEAGVALLAAYDMWDSPRIRVQPYEATRQVYMNGSYRGARIQHCRVYRDESSIRLIDAYGTPDRALLSALAGDSSVSPLAQARDEVWATLDPKPAASNEAGNRGPDVRMLSGSVVDWVRWLNDGMPGDATDTDRKAAVSPTHETEANR